MWTLASSTRLGEKKQSQTHFTACLSRERLFMEYEKEEYLLLFRYHGCYRFLQ